MICGVAVSLNEADICGISLRHAFAHGIQRIYIRDAHSTDGTRDIFAEIIREGHDLVVQDDDNDYWYQEQVTTELIAQAGDEGAEWIVPLDMDEFPYPADGHETLAETLRDCPHDKLYMSRWLHKNWDYRHVDMERMPKVVFRYQPGVTVDPGNHQCSIGGGERDFIHLRELSFRSYEHFLTKNRSRCRTLNPVAKQRGDGWHQIRLEGFSEEQMQAEWAAMQQIPSVLDPIPVRRP